MDRLTNKIYLICGVSGVGKTWVCTQLMEKFNYVAHDLNYNAICEALILASRMSEKPLITECPFAERVQKEQLEKLAFEVIPIFVIEDADLVAARYQAREGRPIQKAAYTRAKSILSRAQEWYAPFGTSDEVLGYLRELVL